MLEPLARCLSAEYRVVLASGSPRRKEILAKAVRNFDVVPSTAEENLDKSKHSPGDYAVRTASLKADEVFRRLAAAPEREETTKRLLVIGSDTVVSADGAIFGKPTDDGDAAAMLRKLSGRSHSVFSGVCVLVQKSRDGGDEAARREFCEETEVTFGALDDEVISGYVATGEPADKAGAYGIQGVGGTLVSGIRGDFYNVMGFPLHRFCQELKILLAAPKS